MTKDAHTGTFLFSFRKAYRENFNTDLWVHSKACATPILVVQVVKISSGEYKISNIFAKESTYPKEIIEF
jgi:hypothetical protein